MHATRLSFAALMFTTVATGALGQTMQAPSARQQPAASSQSTQGTAPQDKGSTGWTGGSRHTGDSGPAPTAGGGASNPEDASQQPEMSTGADLNGPPVRFPAPDTPE